MAPARSRRRSQSSCPATPSHPTAGDADRARQPTLRSAGEGESPPSPGGSRSSTSRAAGMIRVRDAGEATTPTAPVDPVYLVGDDLSGTNSGTFDLLRGAGRRKPGSSEGLTARTAFAREVDSGHIQRRDCLSRRSAGSRWVGDGMAGMPGVAARLFSALGRARVNVRAIAQGTPGRSILHRWQSRREHDQGALRAVHAGFISLPPQTLSVRFDRPGQRRKNLAGLQNRPPSARRFNVRRSTSICACDAVGANRWMKLDALKGRQTDGRPATDQQPRKAFPRRAPAAHGDHRLQRERRDRRISTKAGWRAGIHVITPNKQAGAGPVGALRRDRRPRRGRWKPLPLRVDRSGAGAPR